MSTWTCFHCGEAFSDPNAAREHFGFDPSQDPACRIKLEEQGLLGRLREAEEQLERYRCEDSDAERQCWAMKAEHRAALIKAEQDGYDKGVADARKEQGNG